MRLAGSLVVCFALLAGPAPSADQLSDGSAAGPDASVAKPIGPYPSPDHRPISTVTPAPPSDLEAEIAWARATWPDELKGLHFEVPRAKLLRWVPPGRTTVVYAYTSDYACRRVELTRDVDAAPHPADPHGPGEPVVLFGKVTKPVRVEEGQKVRPFERLWIDDQLVKSDDWYDEVQGADGKWQPHSSGGYGTEGTKYGVLTSVGDRVARFGGEAQVIRPVCSGPFDWLPCAGGGERPCDRCERIGIMLTGEDGLWGHSTHFERATTCHDKCPVYPETPMMKRLRGLPSHVWRPRKVPLSVVPSLYRSRDDCLGEHPPRPAPPK